MIGIEPIYIVLLGMALIYLLFSDNDSQHFKKNLRITNALQKVIPYRQEKNYFTLPKSRDIIYKKLICNQVNHRLYYPNARKVVRNIYALNLG